MLTERFVRALGGPTRPARPVVALTFTNKAARELRDRIRRECRRRVATGTDPGYWRGVVRGLEAARIGTFHSFCGEVLRRHAIEAGIDPGFVVLDEPVAAALRDEALAVALREALAHRDRDLIELAVDFGLGAVRQGARVAPRQPVERRHRGLDHPGAAATWSPTGSTAGTATSGPTCSIRSAQSVPPAWTLIASRPVDNPKVQARLTDFAAAVGPAR